MTGKKLDDRIGKIQFWLLFIGFNTAFLVQHWIEVEGMPRRIANYPDLPGNVTVLNEISSAGFWALTLSILVFFYNVYKTHRYGEKVNVEDPWGFASSLAWAKADAASRSLTQSLTPPAQLISRQDNTD